MLKIRFARTGKKKQAQYRVVVADSKRAVTAKFVEILGWYNPHTKESKIDTEKAQAWLSKGAQPSESMAILMKKNGMKLPKWVVISEKNKKPKKPEAVEAPVADATAESAEEVTPEVSEAPVEEVTEAAVESEIATEETAETPAETTEASGEAVDAKENKE